MTYPTLPSVEPGTPRAPVVTHYPRSKGRGAEAVPADVLEGVLEDWFGAPVALFSAGRVAISAFMAARGFNRYRDHVFVPRFLSHCIMETVLRHGLPTDDPAARAELTLLYHQYGLAQACDPGGRTLEDICHRFFEGATEGRRAWKGEAAVFSLSKFFPLAGTAGGLVSPDRDLIEQVRRRRDAVPLVHPDVRDWMYGVLNDAYGSAGTSDWSPMLEAAYALMHVYPHPVADSLRGMPADVDGLREAGRRRAEAQNALCEALEMEAPPSPLFALPYFGTGDAEARARADRQLRENGIHAGVYSIDVARNMRNPRYEPCLLLPCHQEITAAQIDAMAGVIKDAGA
jgi:hypothetical protein